MRLKGAGLVEAARRDGDCTTPGIPATKPGVPAITTPLEETEDGAAEKEALRPTEILGELRRDEPSLPAVVVFDAVTALLGPINIPAFPAIPALSIFPAPDQLPPT